MTDDLVIQSFFHPASATWSHVVSRGGDAVVIDPVLDYDAPSGRIGTDSALQLLQYATDRDLRVRHILETHAHADHLSAAGLLHSYTSAPIGIGSNIDSVQAHFADVFQIAAEDRALADAFDRRWSDGDTIDAGALRITVMATPGHTPDGVSYIIDSHVFVGDTLFAPDVGTARCDFPGGCIEQLHASIQRLHALPDDTLLWLCHDYPPQGREARASVSVGESKRDNRMLRGDTSLAEFSEARRRRDAALPAPALLYPSLQVNIRGGRLPSAERNHVYLRTPVTVDADVAARLAGPPR